MAPPPALSPRPPGPPSRAAVTPRASAAPRASVPSAAARTPSGGWGGARPGAGRKRRTRLAPVPHRPRRAFSSRHPLHVTLRVLPHVWNLRARRSFRVLRAARSVGGQRLGLRVVEFSIQGNHLHLVVEAADKGALARGMQGLAIRIARGLNGMMGRRGAVFAGRYHARALTSLDDVIAAVEYVRFNHHLHAARRGQRVPDTADALSSLAPGHGVALPWPTAPLLRRARLALHGRGPPRSVAAALAATARHTA